MTDILGQKNDIFGVIFSKIIESQIKTGKIIRLIE